MSKRSSRYSNPKNRKTKTEWSNDKAIHKAKKEHQEKTLKSLGLK